MSKADQVKLIRGEIPPIQSVFFAKMGEMLKHNAQYAQIFSERFKPNPKQQQLFDICDHSEVPPESDGTNLPIHVQCYGPTGSSKSYGVIAYVLRQLLNYPGVQALWVRQKLGDIKKSAWKDVKKFLDTYGIPFEKNESDLTIKLPNGSSIVMSSDLALTPSGSDKADSLGSTAYSFVVFEEADSIRETTAITMAGRMRESVGNFRKVLFYICNPPDEFHWLFKWFFSSDNDPNDPMSRYRALKFDVRDNVKHVGEAYLKGIEQDFARNRFLQKRLGEGEYGIVPKGVPYFMDSFYDYHIQDLRIEGPDGRKVFKWNRLYPLQRGCDPGARGTSMTVMQEDPELKQLRVFFCRLVQDTYLESFLDEVLPELNRLFPGAIWEDFVDTAAKQRTANSEKSCLDIMRAFGMRPRHKPMSVSKGLEILSRMFRTQQMGRQRVVFDPWGAKTLIQAFQGGYCKDPKTGLPIKDGVYDHCVAEGTLIATRRGWVPIEEVQVGEDVATRFGWNKVSKVWDNGVKRVTAVTTDTGQLVWATPEHRFWVKGVGWVRVDALRYSDNLVSIDGWNEKNFGLTELNSYGTQTLHAATYESITAVIPVTMRRVFASITGICGNWSMGRRFPPVSRFITKMATLLTMIWVIWKCCPDQSTCGENTLLTEGHLPLYENTLTQFATKPKSGMDPKKGEYGILKTVKTLGKIVSVMRLSAWFVRRYSKLHSPTGLSFAVQTAKLKTSGKITQVTPVSMTKRVFDLTVDGAHEYLTPAGLCHNCVDSIRYPVTHIFDIGDSGELTLRMPGDYQSFEEKWTPVAGYGTNIFAQPAASMQRPVPSGVSYNNPYSRRRR